MFNLKRLIILKTEKIAFKKFGAKKLAGTFFLQTDESLTRTWKNIFSHPHLEMDIYRCGWRGHPHLEMLLHVQLFTHF
jgi:hypothetical protein